MTVVGKVLNSVLGNFEWLSSHAGRGWSEFLNLFKFTNF